MAMNAPGNTTLNNQRDPYATGVLSNLLGENIPGASVSAPSNAGSNSGGGSSNGPWSTSGGGWGGSPSGGGPGGFNGTSTTGFFDDGGPAIETGDDGGSPGVPDVSAPETTPASSVDSVRGSLGYGPVASSDDQMTTSGILDDITHRKSLEDLGKELDKPPPDPNAAQPIPPAQPAQPAPAAPPPRKGLINRGLSAAGQWLWDHRQQIVGGHDLPNASEQAHARGGAVGAIDTGMGGPKPQRRAAGPRNFNPRQRMAVHAKIQQALDYGRQKHGLMGGAAPGPAIPTAGMPPPQAGMPPPPGGMPPGGMPPGAAPPDGSQQFRRGGAVRAFDDGGDTSDDQTGAIPDQDQAPPAPPEQTGPMAYLTGADAATPQEVQQVQRVVDPHDEMTPNDRASAAVAATSHDDPAAGWSVLQHFRNAYEHAKAFATHALDMGDVTNAVQAMNVGFGNVPNTKHFYFMANGRDPSAGISMTVTDQNGRVATTDFTQEQLAKLMRDRSTMFDAMADMNPVGRMGHGNITDVKGAAGAPPQVSPPGTQPSGDTTGSATVAGSTSEDPILSKERGLDLDAVAARAKDAAAPPEGVESTPVNRALRAMTGYGSLNEYMNRPRPAPAPATPAAAAQPARPPGYSIAGMTPAQYAEQQQGRSPAEVSMTPEGLARGRAALTQAMERPQGGDAGTFKSYEQQDAEERADTAKFHNVPEYVVQEARDRYPGNLAMQDAYIAQQRGVTQGYESKERIAQIGADARTTAARITGEARVQSWQGRNDQRDKQFAQQMAMRAGLQQQGEQGRYIMGLINSVGPDAADKWTKKNLNRPLSDFIGLHPDSYTPEFRAAQSFLNDPRYGNYGGAYQPPQYQPIQQPQQPQQPQQAAPPPRQQAAPQQQQTQHVPLIDNGGRQRTASFDPRINALRWDDTNEVVVQGQARRP